MESVNTTQAQISEVDIAIDISGILLGLKMQSIRRYYKQRFWEKESIEAEHADRIENGVKLENVAAHSWHVADIALLLLNHFPSLNRERCLALAIIHDKLEIFTGDVNPVGKDGQGNRTHAFNPSAQLAKAEQEKIALKQYLSKLNRKSARDQEILITEIINGNSEEARFIKAVDKLQALAFVYLKKQGNLTKTHLTFTLRYSAKCAEYFPGLRQHYIHLRDMLITEFEKNKKTNKTTQLNLEL